jgi:hypothetical protein
MQFVCVEHFHVVLPRANDEATPDMAIQFRCGGVPKIDLTQQIDRPTALGSYAQRDDCVVM